MNNEITITRLKKLTKQRNSLMKKVGQLDDKIDALLKKGAAKKTAKKATKKKRVKKRTTKVSGKEAHPKPGSSPALLCKVMSSRPKQIIEIAKKLKLAENTVKLYVNKYKCFQSAGYGEGYIYVKKGAAGKKRGRRKKG